MIATQATARRSTITLGKRYDIVAVSHVCQRCLLQKIPDHRVGSCVAYWRITAAATYTVALKWTLISEHQTADVKHREIEEHR